MVSTKYLIRLDDACPTMNKQLWGRMEELLDNYHIKPMVGVIPNNEDPKQRIDSEDSNFWQIVKKWEKKGWTIAMHGYNHVYSSKDGGMNPLWSKSEFAGHPLNLQRDKIKRGIAILREHELNPQYFFAPSHTFDENTLKALKEETDIRIISDTIARKPYKYKDFVFIPQQTGHPIRLPFGGLVTICYHPNTMSEESFQRLEAFLKMKGGVILSFNEIDTLQATEKSLGDRILSGFYFLRRKLR